MNTNSKGHDRVLRKRKLPQVTEVEKNENVDLIPIGCRVFQEHNYFYNTEKKRSRWPIKNNSEETLSEDNINDNIYDDCKDLVPDFLKEYSFSSDEECTENEEVKSLSMLLKIEYEKDLEFKNSLNNSSKNNLPSNKMPKLNPLNTANGSTLSVNLVYENTDVEKPTEIFQNISTNSKDTIILQNHKNNGLFDCSIQLNHKVFKLFSLKKLFNKNNGHDSSDDLQNDLQNAPLTFTEDYTEFSDEQRSSYTNSFIIDVCQQSNKFQISPPFDWYHIVYLAIKNSQFEYVTCQEVQHFARQWFPYYCDKTCLKVISTTLKYYNEKYFCGLVSIKDGNSCNRWTVYDDIVLLLESKLLVVVEKFETSIKAALKEPDQLCILLNGYGLSNLGYKRQS